MTDGSIDTRVSLPGKKPRARLPPGPRGIPLLGTALRAAREPLAFLRELGHGYGRISHTRFAHYSIYMVNAPDLIEDVLVGKHRDCIKDKSTRDLMPLAGQGLLTSEGEHWRRQRKLAAPPLQPKRIAGYAETMLDCAERACAGLPDGAECDFQAELMRLTLEIVGKTLLGVDASGQAAQIARTLDLFMDYFERQLWSWEGLVPLSVPTLSRIRMRRAVRDVDTIVFEIIERCRREGSPDDHFLARLIRARDEDGAAMSTQQLRDEAITMLLAGHETTALALSHAVLLLARHPAVTERLRAEVDAVFATRSENPTALCNLPYLNAVARETLRLYPPAYAIGREVVQPLELDGYLLPTGSQIMISPYTVQRDPRCFAEPDRFMPERWLDPATAAPPRFAYFPFGGGPRVCIGNHFALMEIALVLGTLVHRLELEVAPDFKLELKPSVTLRFAGGLPVRVRHRQPE